MNILRITLARRLSSAAALVIAACGLAVGAHALTPSGARISTSSKANYSDSAGAGMPVAASNTVLVTVAQMGGVQISPTTRIAVAQPGSIGYVPVTIQNVGNGPDTFGLTVGGSASWPRRVVADSNRDGIHQSTETTVVTSTPSVAAVGRYKCFLAVMVPAGTTGSGSFTLTAASLFDPTQKAQRTYTIVTSVSGAPSLLEGGEPITITMGLSASAGALSVAANGVQLTAGGGFWTGNVPASSVLGSHNVDIAVTDIWGNVSHNTSVKYTTARVVAANGRALNGPITSSFLGKCIFKTYGKASQVTANSFVVNDGSAYPITVNAPGHSVHPNDFVQARGILQKASGLTLQSSAAKVSTLK